MHRRRCEEPDSLPGVVLFATYSGELGGAERLLIQFAGALVPECVVACPEGALADGARAGGLRVFSLRSRRANVRTGVRDRALAPARLAGHAAEIHRLVRALEPELVVAWGMRSAIACLTVPRLRGRVAFQHNDLLPGPVIARIVRAAADRADLVTALSRGAAADLDPAGRLGSRLQIVHPGVDVERFDADAVPARPPEVILLGAITEWKRPDLALEVVAAARRRRPDLRLRVVGAPFADDGSALVTRLRARARRADLAGAVELVGPVADPRPDLLRATCLLHCAEREPFGIAVLEALAAGRPAVVPNAFGPAEIVDESCGVLYAPGDVAAASEAILSLVDDRGRAAAMGAAGRARAARQFDLETARSRYAAAVAPLLSRSTVTGSRAAPATLGLVTVTHNSGNELAALLASVKRHLAGAGVVVVDCASEDRTLEVAQSFDFVKVVALGENIGFGRACNRGLVEVQEPVSALVNPDVELLDGSLAALAAEAIRRDRPERLLAPLVLSPDGSRQDSVHPSPGTPADVVRSLVPPALVPGRAGLPLAPWRATAPRRVGWAVGCAIVARADTLRSFGPFDERIFMYGEDLELGLRAAQAGVGTWFWPSARVVHHRAHSTGPAFGGEAFERLARARRQTVLLRLGRRAERLDDASQALTFGSRIVAKRLLGRPTSRERRQLRALLRVRRADGRG
jgi:GT2 family glycosyltransferase/glycosyltransferase involved in cell wall biosynthesis